MSGFFPGDWIEFEFDGLVAASLKQTVSMNGIIFAAGEISRSGGDPFVDTVDYSACLLSGQIQAISTQGVDC